MTLPDCMMPDGADTCRGYQELRAEVEALRKNAQRYEWLRRQYRDDNKFSVVASYHWRRAGDCDPEFFSSPEELDAAIDAAMEKP